MGTDFYSKTLSQNLKAIRQEKGLTTIEVAKILGVSQAKVSYIENGKGVLSARDVAVLSRRLDVPVTEFFQGLDKDQEKSEKADVTRDLAFYGAALLAKPPGVTLKAPPFEDVISRAFAFIEDDRLHKAFCTALITQASSKRLNVDRIFALIGNNPYLVRRAAEEARICLQIIDILNRDAQTIIPRAARQIEKIIPVAEEILGGRYVKTPTIENIADLAEFVGECLHAKG